MALGQSKMELVLSVLFDGEDQVGAAVDGLNQVADAEQNVNDVGEQGQVSMTSQISGFTRFGGAISGVTNSLMMFEFMQMRQEMAADALSSAQLRLTNSQMTYNAALEKFGPTSDQAIKAHNAMEVAQNSLSRTQERLQMLQEREYIMLLPMGIQMISSLANIYDMLPSKLGIVTAFQNMWNASMEEGALWENVLTFGAAALIGAVSMLA